METADALQELDEATKAELRKHIEACMTLLGYETHTENLQSMAILLCEYVTGADMEQELARTGIEHWESN